MFLSTSDFLRALCLGGLSMGALLATGGAARAQGTRTDYERAADLPNQVRGKVLKARVDPHWFADGNRFWYRNDLEGGRREFILVDALAGKRGPAFDHARLAEALGQATGKKVEADRIPLEMCEFRGDAGLLLRASGKVWECDLGSYALKEATGASLQAPSLPAGDTPRPSARTGPETSITFANRTAGEIRVFWVDTGGQRQPYGTVPADGTREQHTFAGHVWLVTDAKEKLLGVYEATDAPGTAVVDGRPPERRPGGRRRRDGEAPQAQRPRGTSPDGKWVAFSRESNLWLRDTAKGEETALTHDGSADDAYGEEIYWAPDSLHLVALKTKPAQEHKVTLVQSSPADQLQPKTRVIDYLKPGDRIAVSKPHLFDVAARKEIPVSDALFPNPWDLSELRWEPDGKRFTFLYNQRGHQVLRVVALDAQTGEARAVVDEQSKTFLDYAGKLFYRVLDATGEILWMSERGGWNHLYLYDARTGQVRNQITKGEWVVRGVDRVDEQKRQIWFHAGGIVPGQDPYYLHYCRVNFDGTGLTLLTEGDGTHSVAYSPDGRFFIDSYSRVDLPPAAELRRTEDGKRICPLEQADASALLDTGWKMPERFVAKGRDGKTDIYGVILRPTNFRPERKYPVIECIYAGPQGSFVPKGWSAYYGMQQLSELGFILVQIDGMGTSNRSKAFHDVCWKNLADAGFPDRIAWMKAAAEKYPSLDLTRVGIYGGSAGGQNALGALLFHPEFYKAAAADCGCHDNRMDKIWWNELWMGWPVGPHYDEQSNVTNAYKLQGKLLLTVGEMDDNVDPSSTLQVVNALVRADKDFELIVFPGGGHGSGDSPYGRRRRQDFFVRSLLGVEPRREG